MARSKQDQFDKDQNRFGDQDDNRDWAQRPDRDQMGSRPGYGGEYGGPSGAYGESGGRGSQGASGGDYGRGSDDMWGQSGGASRRGQYGTSYGSGQRDDRESESGWGQRGSYGQSGDYGSGEGGRGNSGRNFGSDWGRNQGGSYGSRSDWSGQGNDRGFLERAGDEVSSWFGDTEAQRRREADHRGKGPRGYTRSDDRIREDVNDRLSDDWSVDASDIDVTVESGEVTLSGTVDSRQAKRRAEDCVEKVMGVKHVQNNLRVGSGDSSSASSGSSTISGMGSGSSKTGSTI